MDTEYYLKHCTKENFIGRGSTRKAYKVDDMAVKIHLHPLGRRQSENERDIYQYMKGRGWHEYFAEVYYTDETMSIQKYYPNLELIEGQSYELNNRTHRDLLPEHYDEAVQILDETFDIFDIKESDNYGLNQDNKVVFIDYGMTKELYNSDWRPLAESGVLPQVEFTTCTECLREKEIRVYGTDTGRICAECEERLNG
ncbi:protein kinase [Corticicoccus populi]|uniref:Protein kinase n=1 Tax=Corticicoccus populi TaxID=1812821 RepID=A0ABW5X108_9STAP